MKWDMTKLLRSSKRSKQIKKIPIFTSESINIFHDLLGLCGELKNNTNENFILFEFLI
jgi:hypothetical protein